MNFESESDEISLEEYLAVLADQKPEMGPKALDKIFSDDWS
jgi:hypothetical protein